MAKRAPNRQKPRRLPKVPTIEQEETAKQGLHCAMRKANKHCGPDEAAFWAMGMVMVHWSDIKVREIPGLEALDALALFKTEGGNPARLEIYKAAAKSKVAGGGANFTDHGQDVPFIDELEDQLVADV